MLVKSLELYLADAFRSSIHPLQFIQLIQCTSLVQVSEVSLHLSLLPLGEVHSTRLYQYSFESLNLSPSLFSALREVHLTRVYKFICVLIFIFRGRESNLDIYIYIYIYVYIDIIEIYTVYIYIYIYIHFTFYNNAIRKAWKLEQVRKH